LGKCWWVKLGDRSRDDSEEHADGDSQQLRNPG
jgi:hypothetical protein